MVERSKATRMHRWIQREWTEIAKRLNPSTGRVDRILRRLSVV
ncbi:hypothetical protein [Pasteuria penetrans]|nr:hypothetical protein [Pasteuria penetrans]